MKRYTRHKIAGFLVLVGMVGLIVLQLPQSQENRSHAADLVVEAEGGSLNGAVTTVTDSQASGGKYIQFTASAITPSVTPGTAATYPAQVLNLTNWKETLPIGAAESPAEIKQPALATYKIDPWFIVSSDGKGVRFRAPVNGVTTSGSGYPRSELREMISNGTANASWSSSTGTHTMFLDEMVTAVPQTKRHIVVGQIHDANDDVIVIRLEYPKLFIDINGADGPVLDPAYTLGKRFTVKFVVSGGKTSIYYNGSTTPAYTLTKSYSGAYFKAGAYTQSNCSTEGSTSLCTASNFGEMVIYQVLVSHQ